MKLAAIWTPAIALVLLLIAAQGCSLDEIITVDVPRDAQKTLNVGDKVTLRDARELREQLVERNNASVRAFDREIADGAFAEELGKATINDILPIAVPAVGTLPGGTILVGLMTGVAGLLTRRPGDSRKIKDVEKEAEDRGYDLGRSETIDTLSKGTGP